ncbi:uncharacterized protein LOC134716625 [Mytilus trossulus]|uniref:uncharacterized protein LOC134716625 n=1 Tax=Mytilus trossulus TaxID=6551 RepID=UPI0030044A49
MATRENLKKLSIDNLRKLATDLNINTTKVKKDDLVGSLLVHNVAETSLTPVRAVSEATNIGPGASGKENLPPFLSVHYSPLPPSFFDSTPKPSFATIYNFLILRSRDDGGNVKNFKGLDRSVKHFDAGDIHEICFSRIDEVTFYLKCFCLASMKKQRYQVYVCVTVSPDQKTMTIDFAYCQCPIGLAQSCSHIGGLLFALSNSPSSKQQQQDKSCTSLPCQWKVPRSVNQKAQPLKCLDLSRPKLNKDKQEKTTSIATFDPRHSTDRAPDINRALDHLSELKSVFPNSGMCSLWNIPDKAPEAMVVEEVTTTESPLLLAMRKMVFTSDNIPPVEISLELVTFIEKETCDQRKNQMWKDLHIGRITSSMFGDILRCHSSQEHLVKQILEGSSLDRYPQLPKAMQWGVDMEDRARQENVTFQKALKGDITVLPTGLTLYPHMSFIGASGDGKVLDGTETGVLEIKCPFSCGGVPVNTMEIEDILNLNSANFCLEWGPTGPQLKRNQKYYAQVQGEMAIMGLPWCDFVVWTNASKNNIFIERICFDEVFCNDFAV